MNIPITHDTHSINYGTSFLFKYSDALSLILSTSADHTFTFFVNDMMSTIFFVVIRGSTYAVLLVNQGATLRSVTKNAPPIRWSIGLTAQRYRAFDGSEQELNSR